MKVLVEPGSVAAQIRIPAHVLPGRRNQRVPARRERVERAGVIGRTVTLKVKFADFTLITRSRSCVAPVADIGAFEAIGQTLLAALFPLPRGIRLLGLGLHSLHERDSGEPEQLGLAI